MGDGDERVPYDSGCADEADRDYSGWVLAGLVILCAVVAYLVVSEFVRLVVS